MNLKSLSKQIAAIKTDSTAGQQLFVKQLAKECGSKNPRPVCPKCVEPLVRTTLWAEGGEVRAWLCKC